MLQNKQFSGTDIVVSDTNYCLPMEKNHGIIGVYGTDIPHVK